MRNIFRIAFIIQLSLLLTLPTIGQSDIPDNDTRLHWRLAHFAPHTAAIDVVTNGSLSGIQRVTFGIVTEWQTLDAGSYDFAVTQANDPNTILWVLPGMSLAVGQWLTIVITEDENDKTVRGHTLFENFAPLPENSSRLTVLYAIPNSPAVDFLVDGQAIVTELSYPTETTTIIAQSVDLTSSIYNVEITIDETHVLVLDVGQVELLPNRNYFAAAVNTSEDPRLVLVATDMHRITGVNNGEKGGKALLRVTHLSSGTPPLDVYVDERWLTTLYFPEFSTWTPFPAATVRMTVTLAGESITTPVIPPFDLTLEPSSYTTVALIGALANNTLIAHPLSEDFAMLTPGDVRVSVLNAHPGAGAIDIQTADGTAYLQNLGYPGFFGDNNGFNHIILENGTYDLQAVKSDNQELLFDLPGTTFYAGRNYFIAAINADPAFVLTFSDLAEMQTLMNTP